MGALRRRFGLGFAVTALVVCGCVSTTDVQVPECVYSNSSFQAVVTVVVGEEGGQTWGGLGVLVPVGWSAFGASYSGPYGPGNMSPDSSVVWPIENDYPSSPWEHWLGFSSDELVQGEPGDTYSVTVTIYTDDIVGSVEIAFLGAAYSDEEPEPSRGTYYWDGDPFHVTVEVEELGLSQRTWGAIKACL
ncbi:hypothetical protein JW921_01505 [Candidatus Fermentibacterales bacterium]|nr:hypothetical protein [Candidatus Fermentibacterales bacterium]